MQIPARLMFLPGASGNTSFWQPLADLLTTPGERIHFGWPGFGPTPHDPNIHGIEDLVTMVTAEVNSPTALIAQSMGGVIALLAALDKPDLITHLVLTVTSGGMNLSDLGAEDWRPAFMAINPSYPPWFADYKVDLTDRLGSIQAPTLLLWGDEDPISPPTVGERLSSILPNSELHVISGGNHDLAHTHAQQIAPIIDRFLSRTPSIV